MAQLIAKCRLTGHYAFMGMDVSLDDVAQLPEIFARKFCPFCACEHEWHRKDAKIVDKRPARRPGFQQSA
jgi:hypothetical protein